MTNSVMQGVDPNFGGGAAGEAHFKGDFDFGDIFNSVFGGFGGFGGRQANPNAPRRGTDTETSIYISFEEAAKGCKQTITFQHVENCEECSGSGAKKGTSATTCSNCGGSGQVRVNQRTPFGVIANSTYPAINVMVKVKLLSSLARNAAVQDMYAKRKH